jgi:hypothetical protein
VSISLLIPLRLCWDKSLSCLCTPHSLLAFPALLPAPVHAIPPLRSPVIFLQHPTLRAVLSTLLNSPLVGDQTAAADDRQETEDTRTARSFSVASIGGGGGSDAVGLVLLRNHLAECAHRRPLCAERAKERQDGTQEAAWQTQECSIDSHPHHPARKNPSHSRPVHVRVYDLEEGWGDAIGALRKCLSDIGMCCKQDLVCVSGDRGGGGEKARVCVCVRVCVRACVRVHSRIHFVRTYVSHKDTQCTKNTKHDKQPPLA